MNRRHFLSRALIAGAMTPLFEGCGRASPTAPGSPGAAVGATVYVSTEGSDGNNGTIGAPWRTISYAVTQLRAGMTLLIRGGTYGGAANVIDSERYQVPSGTGVDNTITIAASPGELVVLRPDDGLQAIRLTRSSPHFLVFQDFTVDMGAQATPSVMGGPAAVYLSSGAHHNRFLRLDIGNNAGNGIEFSDNNGNSPFNEVLQCTLHDNGRYDAVNSGYGAYVFTSDNLFEGNTIYGNGGYGLHFFSNKGSSQVSRNVIRNNRIYDNGRHGGTNYGIVLASGDRNVARDNTISANRGGLMVYERSSNALVEGNTIVNNTPLEGLLITGADGTVVRGNTLSGNATDFVDLGSNTVVSGTPPPITPSRRGRPAGIR